MLQQSFHPSPLTASISVSLDERQAVADSTQQRSVQRDSTLEFNARTVGVEYPDVLMAIERLEESILSSPRVPLTGRTMVDEEALLERLDAIRLSLPEVIATAQEVLQYRHQIIKEAQQQVQQILAEANQRADEVANELGIVERSEQEANQIRQVAITECKQLRQQTVSEVERVRERNLQELEQMRRETLAECQQLQTGADEYADRVLHNMEYQLKDVLQAIQRGRDRLNRDAQAHHESQPVGSELPSLSDRLKAIGDCQLPTNIARTPID